MEAGLAHARLISVSKLIMVVSVANLIDMLKWQRNDPRSFVYLVSELFCSIVNIKLSDLAISRIDLARTRDVIELRAGWLPDLEVVLLLTPNAAEIRIGIIAWVSQIPIRSSVLYQRIEMGNIGENRTDLVRRITECLVHAAEDRRATFLTCSKCGQLFSPERTISLNNELGILCHGCAERFGGIVF